VGAFVVTDTLRLLRGQKLKVAVHAVTTVQEEVGLRGARTAAFAVDPRAGIAVDVDFASDCPSIDEKMVGSAKLGGGPVLACGPTYNKEVLRRLRKTADRRKIAVQLRASPRGANTDAFALQLNRSGVAAGLVSIPCRYVHSPVETIALEDAAKAVELIAAFLADLKGNETW
jgi:endoglucanase